MASVTSRSRDPFFCNEIMSALHPFRVLTILLVAIGAIISAHAADPQEETGFGSNPGNLRMFSYVPESIKPSAPLIVVLHGCKQKAGTFARDAGWLALADTAELAVLMPEQKGLPSFVYDFYVFPWVTAMFGANNQNACFNWFESVLGRHRPTPIGWPYEKTASTEFRPFV